MYVVICNCPPDVAPTIARTLINERLAACVNILPGVTSVYRWEGKVCEDTESTLLIKTGRERYPDLEQRLSALHPYSTPEIIALEPAAVHAPYLAWARAETDLEP